VRRPSARRGIRRWWLLSVLRSVPSAPRDAVASEPDPPG
jgi:hypothetical protein